MLLCNFWTSFGFCSKISKLFIAQEITAGDRDVEKKSNLGQKEGDAKTAGDAAKNNLTRRSKAGYAE